MKPIRLSILLTALLFTALTQSHATEYYEDGTSVLAADDLQQEARTAEEKRLPILLEFSADYCTYCELLENAFLKPMLRNRDYDSRVLIRKINLSSHRDITGFDGEAISPHQLGQHYGVFVTPTVLIVDHQGKELAERLVGINGVDFYGGYLDEAIDQALNTLRR